MRYKAAGLWQSWIRICLRVKAAFSFRRLQPVCTMKRRGRRRSVPSSEASEEKIFLKGNFGRSSNRRQKPEFEEKESGRVLLYTEAEHREMVQLQVLASGSKADGG